MNADAIIGVGPSLVSFVEKSTVPIGAVTGFFFASRLFFVLFAVRVFQQEANVGVAASLALNYLLVAAVVLNSFGETKRPWSALWRQPCFRCVAAYLTLSGLSLVWSVADSKPAAMAFWMAMAADTFVVAWMLRTHGAESVATSLMSGYVWGASVIAAIAWILPAQSDLRLGDEELLGPNQIGWLCGLAFFFAQYLIQRKTGGAWKAHAFLLGVTLLRSLSKTTIIAFVVAQFYILLREATIPRKTKVMLCLAALLVCGLFANLLSNYLDVYTTGNQSESLTGRVGIWAYIFAEALERPWFGHGFHSVWKVIPPFYGTFEARHAHNELLQQFYAYGAAGVALLVVTYGSILRTVRRLTSTSRIFFGGLLIFIVIRGFADTEVFDLSWPMWLIVLFGALAVQSATDGEATV